VLFHHLEYQVEWVGARWAIFAASAAGDAPAQYLGVLSLHQGLDVFDSMIFVIIHVQAFSQAISAEITF
jgi:hypothetical protein